ncbi:MAG: hypothetical protein RQ722_00145 [Desulfuromonadales bacterium]|nr:hypothetical protein [Desulfuromonadales bacterium]
MMLKFGDRVIIRDGSPLDGAEGVVYRIEENRISVLLEREVIWHVDVEAIERVALRLK